jgi:hypothetical protein
MMLFLKGSPSPRPLGHAGGVRSHGGLSQHLFAPGAVYAPGAQTDRG